MCFEFDALPPELPAGRAVIAGGAAAESLTVTAADGNEFAAALAESPAPSGPGVVILPDVRGLYRFYVELAERFAAAGHHAIAFDYFGRTAGTAERGEDFDYKPHVDQTTIAGVHADLKAAREALAERTGATLFASVNLPKERVHRHAGHHAVRRGCGRVQQRDRHAWRIMAILHARRRRGVLFMLVQHKVTTVHKHAPQPWIPERCDERLDSGAARPQHAQRAVVAEPVDDCAL